MTPPLLPNSAQGAATATALVRRLTEAPGLVTDLGGRIYAADDAPAHAATPYVVYQGIYATPDTTHTEPSGAGTYRHYQLSIWASEKLEALRVRDLLVDALDGYRLPTGAVCLLEDDNRDDFDPQTNLYRADADFMI